MCLRSRKNKEEDIRHYSDSARSDAGAVAPMPEMRVRIEKHFDRYDSILESHSIDIQNNLVKKRRRQSYFFHFCMIVMIVMVVLTVSIIVFSVLPNHYALELEQYAAVLTAFLTAFIVLPNTIAKYLFNAEEVKQFADILKAIQHHDETMYNIKNGSSDEKKIPLPDVGEVPAEDTHEEDDA